MYNNPIKKLRYLTSLLFCLNMATLYASTASNNETSASVNAAQTQSSTQASTVQIAASHPTFNEQFPIQKPNQPASVKNITRYVGYVCLTAVAAGVVYYFWHRTPPPPSGGGVAGHMHVGNNRPNDGDWDDVPHQPYYQPVPEPPHDPWNQQPHHHHGYPPYNVYSYNPAPAPYQPPVQPDQPFRQPNPEPVAGPAQQPRPFRQIRPEPWQQPAPPAYQPFDYQPIPIVPIPEPTVVYQPVQQPEPEPANHATFGGVERDVEEEQAQIQVTQRLVNQLPPSILLNENPKEGDPECHVCFSSFVPETLILLHAPFDEKEQGCRHTLCINCLNEFLAHRYKKCTDYLNDPVSNSRPKQLECPKDNMPIDLHFVQDKLRASLNKIGHRQQ